MTCKNNCALKASAEFSGEGMLLFAGRAMPRHSKENHSKDIGLLQGGSRDSHRETRYIFKMNPDLYS